MVKNLPDNAGDTDLIPGSKELPCATGRSSLCTTATEAPCSLQVHMPATREATA